MSIRQVEAEQVMTLREGTGKRFTRFMDGILNAQSLVSGVPSASLRSTVRTNISDGGIDSEVLDQLGDLSVGWLGCKTAWQYKAEGYAKVTDKILKEEINKDYSRSRIEEGFGYRICICDDPPANKVAKWEALLLVEAQAINPDAPPPRVVTASGIARWASRFTSVAADYFQPELSDVYGFSRWSDNITLVTKNYIRPPGWADLLNNVEEHLKFGSDKAAVVLPIQGLSGVGKTRFSREAIETLGFGPLTLYTDNEESALKVARIAGMAEGRNVVIVADECSANVQLRLSETLKAYSSRVRVLAIDNSGLRMAAPGPVIRLERTPRDLLRQILQQNYPAVAPDRRDQFAQLADGFVRIAADLCDWASKSAGSDRFEEALASISNYFDARCSDPEDQEVVYALSLLRRVGFQGDAEDELTSLCAFLDLERREVVKRARRLCNSPGFVVKAGKYFFVTPHIIAAIAFQRAWELWFADAELRLGELPTGLLASLQERTQNMPEQMRDTVAGFFRNWVRGLSPPDLQDRDSVTRLCTLTEMSPEGYLPTLRRLVDQATAEQLGEISGTSWQGEWGPRRSLVWLCERLGAFPEFFDECERILVKLAVAESEPRIGNNATEIWKQFYRLNLSGTAVPFQDRLRTLEGRLFGEDEAEAQLAITALDGLLARMVSRMAGPALVGGRLPPADWEPKDSQEERDCHELALALLRRMVESESATLKSAATNATIRQLRVILYRGQLDQARAILSTGLSDLQLTRVVRGVETFLGNDVDRAVSRKQVAETYREQVESWLKELLPDTIRGDLVRLVGAPAWRFGMDEAKSSKEAWTVELRELASRMLADHSALARELDWLSSDAAPSASVFGEELGSLDHAGSLLDMVWSCALRTKRSGLAYGYLKALLGTGGSLTSKVADLLDAAEASEPKLAVELALAAPEHTDVFERAVRLVDAEALPADHLRVFMFGIGHERLSVEQLREVLSRLLRGVNSARNSHLALEFVAFAARHAKKENRPDPLEDRDLSQAAWQVVELVSVCGGATGDVHWWRDVLEALAPHDIRRAVAAAAKGLLARGLHQQDEAQAILVCLAKDHPSEVMEAVGEVALDPESGGYFRLGRYRDLIAGLDLRAVTSWLDTTKELGARALARHLPAPHLSEEGNPVVPSLTEHVFTKFEDDEPTFRSFCAGLHSLQMYGGDISAQHDQEAAVARKFLNHNLRRIREWAQYEEENALEQAKRWREIEEEDQIP